MKKYFLFGLLGVVLSFSSCDSFLDETPDNRAQLDSYEKIRSILVSAYPKTYPGVAMEWSSDNVYDNGPDYSSNFEDLSKIYKWQPMLTSGSNDSPNDVWDGCYGGIAAANQALQAIEKLGGGDKYDALRGEALICRAFGHFILSNVFCLEYNEETASTDLGLPYSIAPETEVSPQYTRGTMTELYKLISDDIEEALPLIDDAIYSVTKYHFNKRAAYAFAARFNLYYGKFDKSITYASAALTADPSSMMRDWAAWLETPKTFSDMWNAYFDASLPTNFFLAVPSQTQARYLRSGDYARYAHSKKIAETETLRSPLLFWGSSRNLIKGIYGGSSNDQLLVFVCVPEFFEYTDKAAGIGFVHTGLVPLSGSKLILERAEAYAINGELDMAVEDINSWMKTATKTKTEATKQQIIDKFKSISYSAYPLTSFAGRTIKKTLHPQGFVIAEGSDQEMIIQCILHLKRIEFIHEGERFMDIKRYGIEISHNLDGDDDSYVNLPVDDPRRAIQLPQEVIAAGLTPNPTK